MTGGVGQSRTEEYHQPWPGVIREQGQASVECSSSFPPELLVNMRKRS